MELDLNFGGVKGSTGFDAIPAGSYNARIENIEVKETKPRDGVVQETSDGQQARYLNVTYKIMGGDYDGRKIWGINSVRFPADPLDDTKDERQTREIFLGWLNTVSGADFNDQTGGVDLNALLGSEVSIIVDVDTSYDGTPRNKVSRVRAMDAENPLDALRNRAL
jgi:hypothetical protein